MSAQEFLQLLLKTHFTITAEISRAHWLIFIVNKRTSISGQIHEFMTQRSPRPDNLMICYRKNQIDFFKNFNYNMGRFPLCQRFRKFRSVFKSKSPFRFLPTGIFGITSEGGPLISVGIFRPKFAVPFLTNRFFTLIRE